MENVKIGPKKVAKMAHFSVKITKFSVFLDTLLRFEVSLFGEMTL